MKYTLLFALLLLVLGFAAGPLYSKVPDERFARLSKGVNLSHWYAQSMAGYSEKHLSSYFQEEDARLIREMNFTHVRLTLDASVLFDTENPGQLKSDALERFDQRVGWFRKHELAAIVDLHPTDGYKKSLLQTEGAEGFIKDWSALANHLAKTTDPEWVLIEILNEPHHLEGKYWQDLQGRTLEAIREAAPEHTVIVTGGRWGGLSDLLNLTPYEDANVIYTFHFYSPFLFTHQAAEWGWDATRPVSNLGWPLQPEQAEAEAAAATDNKESAGHIRRAVEKGEFTSQWLTREFDKLNEWTKSAGAPRIYVGEFGVYRKAAPPEARLRWHEAVRKEFEERGWGWAIWDYSGGFAVAPKADDSRRPDEQLLKALGLR